MERACGKQKLGAGKETAGSQSLIQHSWSHTRCVTENFKMNWETNPTNQQKYWSWTPKPRVYTRRTRRVIGLETSVHKEELKDLIICSLKGRRRQQRHLRTLHSPLKDYVTGRQILAPFKKRFLFAKQNALPNESEFTSRSSQTLPNQPTGVTGILSKSNYKSDMLYCSHR